MPHADKEERASYNRSYYMANKEKLKIKLSEYYQKNILTLKEKSKNRTVINKKSISEGKRRYYLLNIEAIKGKGAEYYSKNKVKFLEANRNRRAAIKKSLGTHNREDIKELILSQNNLCVTCEKDLSEGYHIDHIIPISKGGSNYKWNLQILCPNCNLRKGTKNNFDFMMETMSIFKDVPYEQ